MVRTFYGTSAALVTLMHSTEGAFLGKALSAALRPKPRIQKDDNNRQTTLKTDFADDGGIITMGYNYDVVEEDGLEKQSLTDITYSKSLPESGSYEYDVYTGPSIAKQDTAESSSSLQAIYADLNKESNPLSKKVPTCSASHMIHVPQFNKKGEEGTFVYWQMALELEAAVPEDGFSITKLSTSFGRKYDPRIKFDFDMTRLRQMEKGAEVIKLPKEAESTRQLKRACERQLEAYDKYLTKKARDNGKNIQDIVMWLTTGNTATEPKGLALKSKQIHHQAKVGNREQSVETHMPTDGSTATLVRNYDVIKGGSEKHRILTDVTSWNFYPTSNTFAPYELLFNTCISEGYEYDVFTGSAVHEVGAKHAGSSPPIEDTLTELNKKTNPLGKKIPTCSASTLVKVPQLREDGEEGDFMYWEASLELEAANAREGFVINKISTSFGKGQNPDLHFGFDMNRLRQMEKKSRTIKLPKKVASEKELKDICERQLAQYSGYITKATDHTEQQKIQDIVMWLTTGDPTAAPKGVAFESPKTEQQAAITARTGRRRTTKKGETEPQE
ncbi:hypothetical protein FOL47_006314 [Perkinsus chesapeaki]|uniref:Uncharacterized protein n=1 Tax=Perkinsus chesapeaki TaxID=330153 RepID=A0A7J6MYY2_PERCH|nr:hypothetical protein FOL47_006314 [Perkinsus chesapeaki]